MRVVLGVDGSVLGADMAGHHGGAVSRVLAVKDENGSSLHGVLEQLRGEEVLVVVVDGTIDVAALVLILETAVNDHLLVELVTVLAVQEVDHGFSRDPGDGVGGVIGQEVRQEGLLNLVGIHAAVGFRGRGRRVASF